MVLVLRGLAGLILYALLASAPALVALLTGPARADALAAVGAGLAWVGLAIFALKTTVIDMDEVGRLVGDAVGEAMAALLAHDEGAAAAPERPGYVEAVRSALRGGGTFVWEWDIDNDRLSDIDEGLQQLGYVGVVVAGLAGYGAIGLLDRFTRTPRLQGFALYCALAGVAVLGWGLLR